jgi:diadenylate cyclase
MWIKRLIDLFQSPVVFSDVVEVCILAALIYQIMVLVQRTRAVQLMKGVGVLLILRLVSYIFSLSTLGWVLDRVIAIGLIAVLILFQPELRRALEQVGRGEFFRNTWGDREIAGKLTPILARVTRQLAQRQIGAIVVIEQRTGLDEYVATGTFVDGQLSEDLLLCLFNVLSPIHDGAAIVRGDRVVAGGCFLPLSENREMNKKYGTRHRAAVGVSEVSDAIVLVVSEERGEVSLAHEGVLYSDLKEEELRSKLGELLGANRKEKKQRRWFK